MIENELRQLISKAKACLTDLCPYTTHVAQLALEDMIQQAEAAVAQDENDKNDESGVLPFTTKRELAIGIGTKRMPASLQRSAIRWRLSGLSQEKLTVHMD